MPTSHHQMSEKDSCSYQRVVLVHGMFQSGKHFRSMKRRFCEAGHDVLAPDLKPADARTGIESLAEQLAEAITEAWVDKPHVLIAHSMGGLICRYYLQMLKGAARCRGLVTLATPHHGTWMAHFYPGIGARQMKPNSDFLRRLHASEHLISDLPLLSFRTPLDLMILPSISSHWNPAENHCLWIPTHAQLPYDRSIQNQLLNWLSTLPRDDSSLTK